MVTHDRYFLDRVATEIIELDKGKLYRYKGNYAYYVEQKAAREERLTVEVEKARNLLKKELEWMRRQPKARGTKAKYRIEAFHELKEKASQDLRKETLELDLKQSRQGGKVLEVEHVTKSFGDHVIIGDFSYVFRKQERIGIIGPNGVGKSTFLDILTGRAQPDSGHVIPGTTTRIGYFTQSATSLNPGHRVIEEVRAIAEFVTLADGSQLSASRFLESFLFPSEKQYTYIDKLSGGEKKRLQLLKLLITNPNFLVLDEPTNDFDIDTLNVLEDFLQKFSGCLLLVSHDRYFMDHLVDHLFVFRGDGEITLFNGNYSDFRNETSITDEAPPEPPSSQSSAPEATPVSGRKVTFKEKQEYAQLQAQIAALESERETVTQQLNAGSGNHEDLMKWAVRIKELGEAIDGKTLRWLELDDLIK
jgi:ATP-binding cassette subfamily F protein uup